MESLHTIAESLPGLLAEGSPGAARAALLRESAEQDDMASVRFLCRVLSCYRPADFVDLMDLC